MVEIFGDRYELDTLELAALLASFGDNTGSYGSPEIDYGGVVVRYSRRTGQIEAVGPGEHGSWERQVRDLVHAHLLFATTVANRTECQACIPTAVAGPN